MTGLQQLARVTQSVIWRGGEESSVVQSQLKAKFVRVVDKITLNDFASLFEPVKPAVTASY